VLEKPFRNYYEKADRMKGMTGENLMTMLESRLDNVVFRMGFARTRREARQVVGHKHVLVNGKCINIPSYLIKAGDVISLSDKAKELQRYKNIIEVTGGRIVPEWIDVDQDNFKGTVKNLPTREMIDVPVNEMLIVELYSK
jgi:small subunit ribosomal protein S4